jgi:hypothetical protein
MAKTHHAIINALKHKLWTQRYEQSTTAHVVRKLPTAVVAFWTTIPNRPSKKTLFGCFRCLDFRINDLLFSTFNEGFTNRGPPMCFVLSTCGFYNMASPCTMKIVTWYQKIRFVNVVSIWQYLCLCATVQLN